MQASVIDVRRLPGASLLNQPGAESASHETKHPSPIASGSDECLPPRLPGEAGVGVVFPTDSTETLAPRPAHCAVWPRQLPTIAAVIDVRRDGTESEPADASH